MARTTQIRSISFDPEVFQRMEDRRRKLGMDRSEYLKRCIIKDITLGGSIVIDENKIAEESLRDREKHIRKRKK